MTSIHLSLDLTQTTLSTPPSMDPNYYFFALSSEEDSEKNRKMLYELVREGVLDDPGHKSGDFETYHDFINNIYYKHYWKHRETTFLASHHGKWIGLTTLTVNGNKAHNGLTVVTKEHRGFGIATALKQKMILVCLEKGIQSISTHVASTNDPMLSINRKLGFIKTP
ncbi:GNAT family N-acetyltransferase [Thermoactinomyces sp. DSM 45892]|uniref:GNAT family N-acetyltransferase n=1 Tax=Thermoactinomyces sp. DSM 45892 TaxID=1882753 RepID=UPI000897BEB8|nr:GNAT family N-acetyltransferase [Thermoactinomyces sp. DSM 45892]SDY75759.1 Acetyltransferase (GNAT) domain-containing protein [Thermoactinomyces sp. DSM 45892]